MLHEIHPVLLDLFVFVNKMQMQILQFVCDEKTNSNNVNLNELANTIQLPIEFVDRILSKKNVIGIKKKMLEHLKIISMQSINTKKEILEHYQHNIRIQSAFKNHPDKINSLKKLNELNENIQESYRGFFSIFYQPLFYEGYDFNNQRITNKTLENQFKIENKIRVCVLCDDSLGDAQIDHFYAKKNFPELSFHPYNLIPICPSCNGRARKGEKAPLSEDQKNQFENWYHPYLRKIDEAKFTILIEKTKNPNLISYDSVEQIRLNNLNYLVDLEERWRNELIAIYSIEIDKLRDRNENELDSEIVKLYKDSIKECKYYSFSLLKTAFYKYAMDKNSFIYKEIIRSL